MGMTTRELQKYLIRRLNEHRSQIHPELAEFAGGRDQSEIDASIADLIKRSAAIAARARAALSPPPDDPRQLDADVRTGYGDPDVSTMPWDDYAQFRRTHGIGQTVNAHGILG